MAPKISVIIPVFNNRENEVQNAIASVIAQTHQDFEIIVVNDCSDDNGRTIADVNACIAKYPSHAISLITHPTNQGVSAARNTGIKKANGEFITTLDSDDLWHPEKLAAQLQAIEQSGDRNNTICLCDFDAHPKNGIGGVDHWRPSHNANLSLSILGGGVYNMGSTMMAHRNVFNKTGLFDVAMKNAAEDWEWLVRHVALGGKCIAVPRVLSTYYYVEKKTYPRQGEQITYMHRKHKDAIRKNLGFRAYRYFISGVNEHLYHYSSKTNQKLQARKSFVKMAASPRRFAIKLGRFALRKLRRNNTEPKIHL
mgnify:CR=1 FL=1